MQIMFKKIAAALIVGLFVVAGIVASSASSQAESTILQTTPTPEKTAKPKKTKTPRESPTPAPSPTAER